MPLQARLDSIKLRLMRLGPSVPPIRLMIERALMGMGELSVGEARFLGELASRVAPGDSIIEIGTLFGFSTKVLVMFKPRGSPLITVDNYRWNPLGFSRSAHYDTTSRILADAAAHHDVSIVRKSKSEFYREYAGPPPGLVFFDANHSYEGVKEDLSWASAVGAKIVCGHDYCDKFPGVKRAVDEFGCPTVIETMFAFNLSEAPR